MSSFRERFENQMAIHASEKARQDMIDIELKAKLDSERQHAIEEAKRIEREKLALKRQFETLTHENAQKLHDILGTKDMLMDVSKVLRDSGRLNYNFPVLTVRDRVDSQKTSVLTEFDSHEQLAEYFQPRFGFEVTLGDRTVVVLTLGPLTADINQFEPIGKGKSVLKKSKPDSRFDDPYYYDRFHAGVSGKVGDSFQPLHLGGVNFPLVSASDTRTISDYAYAWNDIFEDTDRLAEIRNATENLLLGLVEI